MTQRKPHLRRLLLPLTGLVAMLGCLIDVDIADNRRNEIEASTDTSDVVDSGELEDTDTDTPHADCSAVVSPPTVGSVKMIRASAKLSCILREAELPIVECYAPEDGELEESIEQIPYHAIALGHRTFCGIDARDRSIQCVGLADDVLNGIPEGAFSALALTRDPDGDTACGLRVSGEVSCWGDDTFGLVHGAPTSGMCTVSIAQHHGCGIRDNGTLECWGSGSEGVAGGAVPSGTFRDVSVGRDFACAVASTGELTCWGNNANWTDEEAMPTIDARWVASGNKSACALTDTNELACWGPTPDDLPAGEVFEQITPWNFGVCGLRADETWGCWGDSQPPPQ